MSDFEFFEVEIGGKSRVLGFQVKIGQFLGGKVSDFEFLRSKLVENLEFWVFRSKLVSF